MPSGGSGGDLLWPSWGSSPAVIAGARGDHPLQNAVIVHANRSGGGAPTVSVIDHATDPVPAGTRLELIVGLGICTGPDGSEYDEYRGYGPVER